MNVWFFPIFLRCLHKKLWFLLNFVNIPINSLYSIKILISINLCMTLTLQATYCMLCRHFPSTMMSLVLIIHIKTGFKSLISTMQPVILRDKCEFHRFLKNLSCSKHSINSWNQKLWKNRRKISFRCNWTKQHRFEMFIYLSNLAVPTTSLLPSCLYECVGMRWAAPERIVKLDKHRHTYKQTITRTHT